MSETVAADLDYDEDDDDVLDQEGAARQRDIDAASERAAALDQLAMALAESRSEAIAAREASGIELEWLEDEEQYEGIDDANRAEFGRLRGKPALAPQGPATKHKGATVFFNITRPYCDAASAKFGDMLLPTDDRGWALTETPIPELIQIAKGKLPQRLQRQIEKDPRFAMLPPEERQPAIDKTKADVIDTESRLLKEARERADRAEARIEDWHVEGQFHAENRRVFDDITQVGTGILKGPIPFRRRDVAFINGELKLRDVTIPVSRRTSYWNLYPHPECGENIHNGPCIWERDDITAKQLRALKTRGKPKPGDPPVYLNDQIDRCLAENPAKAIGDFTASEGDRRGLADFYPARKHLYEIWYYYGTVKKADLEAAGIQIDTDKDDPNRDEWDVQIEMVNNHVIKAVLNLLDTGEFPYDVMVWQRRKGYWAGVGVARAIRTPQRVVNGAGRNLMTNAGIAGGPMFVYMNGVSPKDGIWEIAPLKFWQIDEALSTRLGGDVTKAFSMVEVPMIQPELMAIIDLGLKMAEDVTGMPAMMRGQQGQMSKDAPLGVVQIFDDNAGTVSRRVARNYDDLVMEPHIRRYYRWLLQHGEDDDEKGDFVVDARGSSALVERSLNADTLRQLLEVSADPRYKKDPAKTLDEWLKSKRLNPRLFDYDDEDWEKIVAQLSQGPQDMRLEVEQIRAQMAEMKLNWQSGENEKDRQQEQAMVALKEQNLVRDRQQLVALEAVALQLERERLKSDSDTSLAKIQGDLTETILQLKAQIGLATGKAAAAAPEVANPVAEPLGRAPDGQAFQR